MHSTGEASKMTELKSYSMTLISRNGSNVYRLDSTGAIITEHKSLVGEYYPLSTKEILNVLDTYGVLFKLKAITIYNVSLMNTQAYVFGDKESITLYPPSMLKSKYPEFRGMPERKIALWTLLHEIGHLTDKNISINTPAQYRMTKAEPYADKFARDNIDRLWLSMIKE
jgi:hypothetical protein